MTTKELEALFTAIDILLEKSDIEAVKKILRVVLKPDEKEKPN